MALDLDRMREKLNTVTGKGGSRTDFWKPQDGESNVRNRSNTGWRPIQGKVLSLQRGTRRVPVSKEKLRR